MNPSSESPHDVLGVSPQASETEIRAAYLRKVRECPPDRQAEAFERIRDAYDVLRDPRRRAERMLAVEPYPSFVSLLEQHAPLPTAVGPDPWLAAMQPPKETP